MSKIVVAIVAFGAWAASAEAGLVCTSPQELKALQSAALQQQLTVAAASCRLADDYNRFLTAYREQLGVSEQALREFFAARPRGEDYAAFKTRIANTVSLKSTHDPKFCDSARKVFDTALGRAPERNGLAPEPPQLVSTGYEGCRPVDDAKLEVAQPAPRPSPAPIKVATVKPSPRPHAVAAVQPAPKPQVRTAPSTGLSDEGRRALALADPPKPEPAAAPKPLMMAAMKPVDPPKAPAVAPKVLARVAPAKAERRASRVSADEDPSLYPQPKHANADEDPRYYAPSRVSADEDPARYAQPRHANAEEDPRYYAPSRVSADEDPYRYPQPRHANADEDPQYYAPSRVSADEDPARYPQPRHANADEDPQYYAPSRVSPDEDPSLYPQPTHPNGDEDPAYDRPTRMASADRSGAYRTGWRHPDEVQQIAGREMDDQAYDNVPNAYRPGAVWVNDNGWRPRRRPHMILTPDGRWVVVIGHQSHWVRE